MEAPPSWARDTIKQIRESGLGLNSTSAAALDRGNLAASTSRAVTVITFNRLLVVPTGTWVDLESTLIVTETVEGNGI